MARTLIIFLIFPLLFFARADYRLDDDMTYMEIADHFFQLDSAVWAEVNDVITEKRWLSWPQNLTNGGTVEKCELCRTGLGVLMGLIKSGRTYEDLKNLSLHVCSPIVKEQGYNPDILCEMLLDVYGPHVVYILNATTKTAHDICGIYRFCPDTEKKHKSTLQWPPSQDKQDRKNRKQKRKFLQVGKRNHEFSTAEEVLRILHISDTHPDDLYAAGYPSFCDMPLCCRADSNGNGSARNWGDYGCNTPQKTITHMFDFISQNLKPHMIIYTGDTPMHTVWNQTLDSTIKSYKWLTDQLSIYFPGIHAFPTFGNHDTFPTNLYYPNITETQELNDNMYVLWRNLSGFNAANEQSIKDGGYYNVEVLPGLRVISLNSNFVFLENYYSILNMEENPIKKMMLFLEKSLSQASANQEQVILINHQLSGGDDFIDGYDQFINSMRVKYSNSIFINLVGHSHHDSFSMIRDKDGIAKGIQLVAPSMTTYRDVNPSFRMIYARPSPLHLFDLVTYRLDIESEGNSENPKVLKAYSFREDYEMQDLAFSDFDDLIQRMSNNVTLFDQYRSNYASGRSLNPCDEECQEDTLCLLRYADYEGRQHCHMI